MNEKKLDFVIGELHANILARHKRGGSIVHVLSVGEDGVRYTSDAQEFLLSCVEFIHYFEKLE